jgi:hypothetical protein
MKKVCTGIKMALIFQCRLKYDLLYRCVDLTEVAFFFFLMSQIRNRI